MKKLQLSALEKPSHEYTWGAGSEKALSPAGFSNQNLHTISETKKVNIFHTIAQSSIRILSYNL